MVVEGVVRPAFPSQLNGVPVLTFIIPVRHQDNAADWSQLVARLTTTVASLERQTSGDWRAVIAANRGADLPDFSEKVTVHRVDLEPNRFHEPETADRETYRDAVRLDKGLRILAGMRAAGETDYFMVVDDDDFVSREVAGYVGRHAGEPGWNFEVGYVWPSDGNMVMRYENFHRYCGTSHVVRADLVDLDVDIETAEGIDYVKRMLGSHISIATELADRGTPLAALPFPGAVYRIGHAGSHSKSSSLLRTFVLRREFVKRPGALISNLLAMRPLSSRFRAEFFGTS